MGLFAVYTKFSRWIGTKRFSYTRPHLSRFIKTALLPVFAIIFVSSMSAYIQISILDNDSAMASIISQNHVQDINNEMQIDPQDTFAKILNSITIIVIGFTIARLIPIILNKRQKTGLEVEDFERWKDMRGFDDDKDDLFHQLFEWVPPKKKPEDLTQEEFESMLQTDEGRLKLEQFRTSKGQSIGTFKASHQRPIRGMEKIRKKKVSQLF